METKGSEGPGSQRASAYSGERHSHFRHREEQVQAGSGPGMFKELQGEQWTNKE